MLNFSHTVAYKNTETFNIFLSQAFQKIEVVKKNLQTSKIAKN